MPLTVGIPFFNNEGTLPDAIRSVFAQTYQEWELVLVNDGSTDGSLDVAMAVKDPRVRVISDGVNKKAGARRNQIVAEAKHELLAWVDADDMMSPLRFERQLPFFDDRMIQIVDTGICAIDDSGVPKSLAGLASGKIRSMVDFFRGQVIAQPTMMARTQWFRENSYDPSATRTEDYELWCRARCEGKLEDNAFHRIPEPLFFYREQSSMSVATATLSVHQRMKVIRELGPGAIGTWRTQRELWRVRVRSRIVRLALALGLHEFVARRRRQRLDERDAELVEQVRLEIAQVKNTKVPGLD